MTEEGALWEDMHHFVDYLTCKDVPLAYELNSMLLKHPRDALEQFWMIVRLLNRQLCNHEVLGRGYIFTKEPVLSPSVLVGQLVLQKKIPELKAGMQYLWILNRSYVLYQRDNIRGVDLHPLQRSALMLTEACTLLHQSAGWSEAHFVDVLKEFAIFDPTMAANLHDVTGAVVLAELIGNHKRVIQRFLDLMRRMKDKPKSITLMNELGSHSQILLHPDEDIFQSIVQWLPTMECSGYNSMTGLRLCRALFVIWDETDITLTDFMDRLETLKTVCPKAFEAAVRECADDHEDHWSSCSLLQMVMHPDRVKQSMAEIQERYLNILSGLPVILSSHVDMSEVVTGLDRLCLLLPGVPLIGPFSIEMLLQWRPQMIDVSPDIVKMIDCLRRVTAPLTDEEIQGIQSQNTFLNLLEAGEKLYAVMQRLEETGLDVHTVDQIILEKIEGIRKWKRHACIPPEIIQFMNAASVYDVTSWLQFNEEDRLRQEERLFLLFGNAPGPIFRNLTQMPELLQNEKLEYALSAARCLKVGMADIRNVNFRSADRLLTVLIDTIESMQSVTTMNVDMAVHYLERLADQKLLSNAIDVTSTALMQFCILCVEHPGTWKQFEDLMEMVHHPTLDVLRPLELQKMKMDAVVSILKAPEVFLIRELWDMMMEYLHRHQWTFAGLDLETVMSTEPSLLIYAVQRKWIEECKRDASVLMAMLEEEPKVVRRRGKSVVNVGDMRVKANHSVEGLDSV